MGILLDWEDTSQCDDLKGTFCKSIFEVKFQSPIVDSNTYIHARILEKYNSGKVAYEIWTNIQNQMGGRKISSIYRYSKPNSCMMDAERIIKMMLDKHNAQRIVPMEQVKINIISN